MHIPKHIFFFSSWAISTCNRKNAYSLYAYAWRRSGCCICPFIPSFLSLPPSPNFCMYLSVLLPRTAPTPTPSGRTEVGWLSESIPESAARPLPESYDSHSSSFPLPRGQASSSSARGNDPSVWHTQNPESPHLGVWVQIPPPGGRAGTPANDSEMRRVSTLVSWSTEGLCMLNCTFPPITVDTSSFLPAQPFIIVTYYAEMSQE